MNNRKRTPIFINLSMETFTPSESGAIATIIWECCREASKEGIKPVVITQRCKAKPYEWPDTIFLDHPPIPRPNTFLYNVFRAERKLMGWRHIRQRTYAMRVIDTIRKHKLEEMPFILFNDPETAVLLRQFYPKSFILHWFQNQQDCKYRFRKKFAKAINVTIAVSNFTARWVEKYYGLKMGSVSTVYNGVDIHRFYPEPEPDFGPPVISFVGRTGIEKAPDLLLKAALMLANRTKNFSIQIIGSNYWDRFKMDPYQLQLKNLADKLTVLGIRVNRPGHITRYALPKEYHKAYIHVTPSRWDEPFGLTTLEGMASGLAVVVSNTGGSPEVVGDTGFLFKRESIEELSEHLYNLVTNQKIRLEYGKKARKRAENFTFNKTWSKLKMFLNL